MITGALNAGIVLNCCGRFLRETLRNVKNAAARLKESIRENAPLAHPKTADAAAIVPAAQAAVDIDNSSEQ